MKFIRSLTLNNSKLYLGFLTIQDKNIVLRGFQKLSNLSKRYRFHRPKRTLTELDLQYLLNIDNFHHLAIGVLEKTKKKTNGVGLIRYIREKNKPDEAEVAITVVDEYQNRGFGTLLYKELLTHAKQNGINTLIHYVQSDNCYMLKLLEKFGAIAKYPINGTIKVIVKI